MRAISLRRGPRIRKAGVVEQRVVSQRFEKRDHIRPVLRRKLEAADQGIFVRVVVADTSIRPRGNGSTAGRIMIEHAFEGRDAAVVHVGRGHGDIAQGGRFELADVLKCLRVLINTRKWVST
jgi:hypothetical protein